MEFIDKIRSVELKPIPQLGPSSVQLGRGVRSNDGGGGVCIWTGTLIFDPFWKINFSYWSAYFKNRKFKFYILFKNISLIKGIILKKNIIKHHKIIILLTYGNKYLVYFLVDFLISNTLCLNFNKFNSVPHPLINPICFLFINFLSFTSFNNLVNIADSIILNIHRIILKIMN